MVNFMEDCFSQDISLLEKELYSKKGVLFLASLVQNLAGKNAEKCGYDRESILSKSGGVWIVTKIKFKINTQINNADCFLAKTWPLPAGKVKVSRQFSLENNFGEQVVSGASEWCIININTRRPIKIEQNYLSSGYEYITEPSGAGDFKKINHQITNQDFAFEYIISENDIDINGHTNNNVYTAIVLNSVNDMVFKNNKISEYELHFVKETMLGQKIKVYKTKIENGVYVTGMHEESVVFKACLNF